MAERRQLKVLLFGSEGQVGSEFRLRAAAGEVECIAPLLSEVDITRRDAVIRACAAAAPRVIINCAAYTAVDKAEENREAAYGINADGAGFIAEAARECGARLIHISTDYVFDGSSSHPIAEDAPTNPINVYGASKLAGEEVVMRVLGNRTLIVRTSSVHGIYGVNFVHTIVRLLASKGDVRVVADQIMSPTWAGWLAEVLLALSRIEHTGIVNACCSGALSWYEFASEIRRLAGPRLSQCGKVVPVSVAEFPRPARRPTYSVLDCTRLTSLLGQSPLSWREGLVRHLEGIDFSEVSALR